MMKIVQRTPEMKGNKCMQHVADMTKLDHPRTIKVRGVYGDNANIYLLSNYVG